MSTYSNMVCCVQSLSNKSGLIHDHILDKGIDIPCLSETWQQPDVYSSLNEACPPGYCYLSKPRITGQGGGLAVIHSSDLVSSPVAIPNMDTFESLVFNCKHPFSATVTLINRPPKPHLTFIFDMHSFLISLCTIYSNGLVIGDFNVNMDSQTCRLATDFKHTLDCINLHQLVDVPTLKATYWI